jgi:hypothetical protein
MHHPPKLDFACPALFRIAGEGPIRHCDLCQRAVHDLSAMTEREAEDFLRICHGQDICIQYTVEDDTVLHRPAGQLGKVVLALGLGLAGLAVAQWVRSPAAPKGEVLPGAGAALQSTPVGLQALVNEALLEAERGWPVTGDRQAQAIAEAERVEAERAAGGAASGAEWGADGRIVGLLAAEVPPEVALQRSAHVVRGGPRSPPRQDLRVDVERTVGQPSEAKRGDERGD